MFKQLLILIILFQISFTDENLVRIIATANVHGEVDPCGWKKKPTGGLARKATLLDDLYLDVKNFYVIDAGNLFFKQDIIDPGIPTEIALINADIIVKSFNEMGCTAFSPGSKDFAAGKDFLLSMSHTVKSQNYFL